MYKMGVSSSIEIASCNKLNPGQISEKLNNSIVKIQITKGGNEIVNSTGFFMIIEKNNKKLKFLLTCGHLIQDNEINNKSTIKLSYANKDKEEERKIKLDKNIRYIKTFIEEDITLIEIIKEDYISEDKYLNIDLNYENGYNTYKNKKFYLVGFQQDSNEKFISTGIITQITNYKFNYTSSAKIDSLCSPICDEKCHVIGVHNYWDGNKNINIGTFILQIINNLKIDEPNKKELKKENLNMNNNINSIIAEIFIKDHDTKKYFRIINSYEQNKREIREIKGSYINENENEIKEKCEIKINGKIIPFSYFYKFESKGKNIIEYTFKNALTNANFLFSGCKYLKKINLSNFNTMNITNMREMFSWCKNLEYLDLSSFNTENVTDMESMFNGCKSLKKINLSSFNTENVVNMESMFSWCQSLKDLDLYNFNTKNVISMKSMFDGCASLKNLNLSNFNTQKITNMEKMFKGCESMINFNLSAFNTQNVTNMKDMFSFCSSLTYLNLTNFNTVKVTDMANIFFWCKYLKSLNLSNFNTQNVIDMGYMFEGCKSLINLDLSNFNTQNVKNMRSMFGWCESLTNLNLSNFNTQNVKNMQSMFTGCKSLTNLNLSNFNTQKVTNMEYMFKGCESLTNLKALNNTYIMKEFENKNNIY